MYEERTELLFRQREHISCHLWHIYSVTVNQVMVAIVKHYAIIIITKLGIVVKAVVEQAYTITLSGQTIS